MSAERIVFYSSDVSPSFAYHTERIPAIKDGELLAEIQLASICRSDLHTLNGNGNHTEAKPSVLGHEAVATVVINRRHGCHLRPGDRITFSVFNSCGNCHNCDRNIPQKCSSIYKYGHSHVSLNSGFTGCYSSHIILGPGTHIIKLPNQITDVLAAPVNCALATAVNAISKVAYLDSQDVALVQGAGLLGVYCCALLKEMGFPKVYCTDINTERLELITRFGAIPVNMSTTTTDGVDLPKEVDVVIDVSGTSSVVQQGVSLLRPAGIYVFVGMGHPNTRLDITGDQIIQKCLTIVGIHNYAPVHLDLAVNFLARTANKYPYELLMGPAYPLTQFKDAVAMAATQKYHRVVVHPGPKKTLNYKCTV